MASFRLTRAALAYLRQIGRYTEQHWGRAQRDRYLRQIDAVFRQLAEFPELGPACDDIRRGYRKFPVLAHVIFYRIAPSGEVEIIRILHKSMDVDTIISS